MSRIHPFSIFDAALAPRMVIEASAGTGKTWNITGFFLRLLLEKKAAPEQILVVTFTRMATRELKERIMERLRRSLRAVETGCDEGDPFLSELIGFCRDRQWAGAHIREAIRNFDDARILTIHGFCQQILQEESLVSGIPFDMEFSQSDDLLKAAAEDFWRMFVHEHGSTDAGKYYISKAMEFGESPQELLKILGPVIRHRNAGVEAVDECDPVAGLQDILDIRKEMQEVWQSEKERILERLLGSEVKYMTQKNLESRAAAMELFFSDHSHGRDTIGQLKFFDPAYFQKNLKKNRVKIPEHPFFDLCEEYRSCVENIPKIKTWFLRHAALSVGSLRERMSLDSSVFTYDDLLVRLEQALLSSGTGGNLAVRIREKYPYALVDEFQDTDSVQYRIFEEIYPADPGESLLMMIGDPKQSIYAFRGADLYSYLRARKSVSRDARYTLGKNYRSRPGLIEAVNILFGRNAPLSFLEEQIDYYPIRAGNPATESEYVRDGGSPVPVQIFHHEGGRTKGDLKPVLFREAARQIMELIRQGRDGEATLAVDSGTGRRNLNGGDIAVLVSSHRDIEMIRGYLKEHGVPSVTYSREKIFETEEAVRLSRLFTSILEPANFTALQTALATGFFGNRLSTLYELQKNEHDLLRLTERLQALNELWHRSGSFLMLRKLLFEQNALEHLAELHDNERILTNIQQLMELTAFAERRHGFDPPALLRWFKKKMADASDEEEETLRLESEGNLVRILTIHNSKGLEFPVVFCPGLWEGRDFSSRRKVAEVFHQEKEPHRLVINLEQYDCERRRSAVKRARFEEICEEVRKTYVAVTRAKYECRIFWGTTDSSNLSGMGSLLIGRQKVMKSIEEELKVGEGGIGESELTGSLAGLARDFPHLFSFSEIDGEVTPGLKLSSDDRHADLSLPVYRGEISFSPGQTLHSFSSLTAGEAEPAGPDYDQYLEELTEYISRDEMTDAPLDIFHFPRGKTAGTFIHKLFEQDRFDFRRPDYWREIIEELLPVYGFEEKWTPVLERMIHDVAGADYGALALQEVAPDDMLREMEFTFPVSPPRVSLMRGRIGGKPAGNEPLRGGRDFMTGFIDLVVRHKGIYYIIDYKSNYLGDRREFYNEQALNAEMANAGYDLQYHLYVVALRKYLEQRDPAFQYDSSFGGVYYLFVRGMEKNSSGGIYFDRPEKEVIDDLEHILKRND